MICSSRGFSLIEVVAAVAIFSAGIVGVLALFAPVTRSIAAGGEVETAARLTESVRARLSTLSFAAALTLIQDPATVQQRDRGTSAPPGGIVATRSGDIGFYESAASPRGWYDSATPAKLIPDAERFFEIDLIRNEALSPAADDALASMVAFTVRVRWPVTRTSTDQGIAHFDHGRKQVLFLSGFITR